MDGQDKRRFVQQYVERQKAYLPTYTAAHLENERHGTPPKPVQSDRFGFDTPILRSRIKNVPSESALPAGQGKTRPPPVSSTKEKRKKAPTPASDVDTEHVARLADRRERKRKKRAIVNPPQKRDDAAPPKGSTTGKKIKKPAALALLYGFSATNVTKDRLTVRPAPSLGVFSKGKASAKKKVIATSSRNDVFSECAFLNKPSVDHSKVDGDSLVSDHRVTKRTKDRRETPAVKTAPVTMAGSEVWDIEVQSKLPSSARDVSSEAGGNETAPVVLDLRGAEWSASVDAADGHEEHRKETLSRSLSAMRSSPQAISDVGQELRVAHAVERDAPSIHPSHSASQVGRRAGDTQQTQADLRQVTPLYFTEAESVSMQESIGNFSQRSRSNDSGMADQDGIEEAALDVRTATWTPNSLMSVAPMAAFQTGYDMVAPLVFSSDCSAYEDFVGEEMGSEVQDTDRAESETRWDWWQSAAGDDVDVSDWYDPLAPEHEEEDGANMAEFLEGRALLLGVPQWPELSGLAQAEMDVARGLRDHWRPVRLW